MRLGSKKAIDDIWFSVAKPGECQESDCTPPRQLKEGGSPPDCCECPPDTNKECEGGQAFVEEKCVCEGCEPDVDCQTQAPKTFKVKNGQECSCVCEELKNSTKEQLDNDCKQQNGEGSAFNEETCECECNNQCEFVRFDNPLVNQQAARDYGIANGLGAPKTCDCAGVAGTGQAMMPGLVSFEDPSEELAFRAMNGMSSDEDELSAQNFVRCFWWWGTCPGGATCFRSMISCQLYFDIPPESSSSSSSCDGEQKRVLVNGNSHYVCCPPDSPGLSYALTTSDDPLECDGTAVDTGTVQYCFECLPTPRPPSPGSSGSSGGSSSSSDQYYCVVDKIVSPSSTTSMYDFFDCVTTEDCQSMFGPSWYAVGVAGPPPSCFCLQMVSAQAQSVPEEGGASALAFRPGQQSYCVSASELNPAIHQVISGPYSAGQCNENCGQKPSSSSSSGEPSPSSSSSSGSQPPQPSSSSQDGSSSSSMESSSSSSFECPDIEVPTDCRCGIAAEVTPDGCVELYCDECEDGDPPGGSSPSSQPPGCPYPRIPQCGCDTYGVDTDENGCVILVCRCPDSSTSGGESSSASQPSSSSQDGSSSSSEGDGAPSGPGSSGSSDDDGEPSSTSQPSSSSESSSSSEGDGAPSGPGSSGSSDDDGESSSTSQPSSSSESSSYSGGDDGESSSASQPSSSSESSSYSGGDDGEPSSTSQPSSSSDSEPGTSSSSGEFVECPTCGGEGTVENSSSSSDCPTCGGTGRVPNPNQPSSPSSDDLRILQGPTERTVVVGQGYSELFTVSAASSDPIDYQWQQSVAGGSSYSDINPNGGVFSGVNSPILGVNAGMTDLSSVWNGAKFRCVVESAGKSISSDAATLTVIECGECEALGEEFDDECVCSCRCPAGSDNNGVVFAPNGDLVCECVLSEIWAPVSEKPQSSSNDQVFGIMSDSTPSCVSLDRFDDSIHEIYGEFIFASESECFDSLLSSSSSEIYEQSSSSSN
jgi:hypothetical protein